jgi:hypothetical protein
MEATQKKRMGNSRSVSLNVSLKYLRALCMVHAMRDSGLKWVIEFCDELVVVVYL